MHWIAGPLPIGTVLLHRCGDERDGLLPTRYVLADVPYVIRRPCPLAGDSLGLVSGGWCFPSCQNCSVKRTHWAHPVWTLKILALRRRALAGRRDAADRCNPLLRNHITACYTGHQAGKR